MGVSVSRSGLVRQMVIRPIMSRPRIGLLCSFAHWRIARRVTFHYRTLNQITDDISDARVYGGIHFRFDSERCAIDLRPFLVLFHATGWRAARVDRRIICEDTCCRITSSDSGCS